MACGSQDVQKELFLLERKTLQAIRLYRIDDCSALGGNKVVVATAKLGVGAERKERVNITGGSGRYNFWVYDSDMSHPVRG
jgi:hypothetical protein